MDNKTIQENIKYETLTPNDVVENRAEDALDFALKSEKINNIAITGPYSSGKSSIIQSYFNKKINKNDYLNISLATFQSDNKNITNSLEKTIIEKLYYSILKKYEKHKNIISCIITGFVVALINMWVFMFNQDTIINSLDNNFTFTLIFIALEISCLTAVIYYAISYALNLQKIKLKIGDIEFEVNQQNNNSLNLLNEELEFIIRIMNFAKYKYVIFEDLDRFEDPIIFERLRDLNITLNASLKQKVKFIYAIRDEMFIAENRTKFFDFIVPVVPYTSYENSGEVLYKLVKDYKLEEELTEDFILDIGLFVSDIRILKNTLNEYIIYKKTLDKEIPSYENLFAILLYKNTCSKDFASLQKKEGTLYNIFKTKHEKIENLIEKKRNQLQEKNEEYKKVENSLTEMRNIKNLFIYNIKSSISNSYDITLKENEQVITTITYGMNVDNIPDDKMFSDNLIIKYYNGGWVNQGIYEFFNSKCPEFAKEYIRYKDIINNSKEKIITDIKQINEEIEKIKESTLAELLEKDTTIVINFNKYDDLMTYLLTNGYINENYLTYINKFHEGSITENDYIYITSVKNNKNQDYNNKIDNPLKVINRLKEKDFRKEQILNLCILDNLIINKDCESKKDIFIETLINSNKYIEFLGDCLNEKNNINNKKQILNELCKRDIDIWQKIKKSTISEESKNSIIEQVLINTDIHYIHSIKEKESLVSYVEEKNLLKNKKLNEVENILKDLNIKYSNIIQFIDNTELYKFIIDNNIYQINYENIEQILINNNITNIDIKEKNYEKILENSQLKEYVNSNIQLYMDDVYEKLDNKQKNSNDLVVELLNNENINLESKKTILNKETEALEDISTINKQELYKMIFENNLIRVDWDNINKYYNLFGLDNVAINFINNNSIILIQEDTNLEDEISKELLEELLLNKNLNEETYSLILQHSNYKIINADISDLNSDKLLQLINNKKIEFNLEMLENIRKCSSTILIEFIGNNYISIYSEINKGNIVFSNKEIETILNSTLSLKMKIKAVNMIENNEDEEISLEFSNSIVNLVLNYNIENILNIELLEKLLINTNDIIKKVQLINLNFESINRDNISEVLSNVGEKYCDIVIDRRRPRFDNNKEILLLLEKIQKLGYNINFDTNDDEIVLTNTKR